MVGLLQGQMKQKDAEISRLSSKLLEDGVSHERSKERERAMERLNADLQRLQAQLVGLMVRTRLCRSQNRRCLFVRRTSLNSH